MDPRGGKHGSLHKGRAKLSEFAISHLWTAPPISGGPDTHQDLCQFAVELQILAGREVGVARRPYRCNVAQPWSQTSQLGRNRARQWVATFG
jgi:hypothetical protein